MKKITFKKLVFLPFILCGFLGLSQTTIITNSDAYTWNRFTNNNYSTQEVLLVRQAADDLVRYSYLKFDLSSLSSVNSAKFRLTLVSDPGATRNYEAFLVTNDSWTETGITWSNAPASGVSLGVVTNNGQTVEWDVMSGVLSEMAGDKLLSIKVVSTDTEVLSSFCSKETTTGVANKPKLVINDPTLSVGDKSVFTFNNVIVYPNPTTDNLYVKGLEDNETTVSIYNTVGQLLKQEVYRSNVDLSTFKTGLYYAKIKNELGQKTVSFLKK